MALGGEARIYKEIRCGTKRETWYVHSTGEGVLRCRIDEIKCLIKINIVIYIDL